MPHPLRIAFALVLSLPLLAAPLIVAPLSAQQWTAPTPEELSMTSQPQVPGAQAVFLYREETNDDILHVRTYYARLKVLTEGGKDLANVELPYFNNGGQNIDVIAGRTIHPDGTITPFTGKPYEKLIEKAQGYKLKEKIFTLPAVEVGSIIEYRYKVHYDDSSVFSPDWYIQGDLYTRKAHYSWKPQLPGGSHYIADDNGNVLDRIAWMPLLPPPAAVKTIIPPNGGEIFELDVSDIPPLVKEDQTPPMQSLSYRVLFYYTGYKTADEFWTKQGKMWSNRRDKFIGPGSGVKAQAASLVSPGDTPDQKSRKIYAFIMTLENTDFTRQRSTREEQAEGLKQVATTDDILKVKRGSSDQLAMLYVALARAAGLKAYVAVLADRQQRIFLKNYLSFVQMDDDLAIVNIDGKDVMLDPGQRYCKYGQLAWQHYLTEGIRQVDGSTALVGTGGAIYKEEHTSRVADLTLDEHGLASGTVTINYEGNAALHWRHEALRGDETSLKNDLKENLEHSLPGGMEVKVSKIENLTDGEKPLAVAYEVKGAVGSPTGKRLLVPASLFEANTRPRFPGDKREQPIDMHYPAYLQDAVRFKLPAGLVIESSPAAGSAEIKDTAIFSSSARQTGSSVTLYRNVSSNATFFKASQYPELRSFYQKIEAKDQEAIVITHADGQKSPPSD